MFKQKEYSLGGRGYWNGIEKLQEYAEEKYGNASTDGEYCGVFNDDVDLICAMGDDIAHTAVVKSEKAFNDKELMKLIRENEKNEYSSPDSEDDEEDDEE